MSQEKFFDFSSADAGDGSQVIPPIATFTHRSPDLQDTSTEKQQQNNSNNGPGYYVDATVSSSSSNDSTDANNGESVPSTPTEVIQHPPRPEDQQALQQQQQLSATMAFHQAAAAQQAAQLAANAAALQAAHAQQAMAAASQASNMCVPNVTVAQSLASMSLQHHQTITNVTMSNGGVIAATSGAAAGVCSIAAPISMQGQNTDGTVIMGQAGTIPLPMMMHHAHLDHSQGIMLQQHAAKGNKGMPPTPPASADEKDHDDPEKKKTLINMIAPNAHGSAVPVSIIQQHNGHNITNMQPQQQQQGDGVPPPGMQMHMQQFAPGPYGVDRMPPMQQNDAHLYDPHQMDPDEEDDQDDGDDMSPSHGSGNVRPRNSSGNKRRGGKKPVPVEDKDDKYFERRKRNNMAAKRSRDARKQREDTIAMRANYLERENAILRAQLATLREEANSLRQLLSQRTMSIGPNGQSMNIMQ